MRQTDLILDLKKTLYKVLLTLDLLRNNSLITPDDAFITSYLMMRRVERVIYLYTFAVVLFYHTR